MAARDNRAMAGIAAAAVALGVTQLLAAFVGPEADARTAIGSAVIDLTPGPVKEFMIQTFGTADKLQPLPNFTTGLTIDSASNNLIGGDQPGAGTSSRPTGRSACS